MGNRSDLLKAVAKQNGTFSYSDVLTVLDVFFRTLVDVISCGGRIELRRFGTFVARKRSVVLRQSSCVFDMYNKIYFRASKFLLESL